MGRTTFSGPVKSKNGFEGEIKAPKVNIEAGGDLLFEGEASIKTATEVDEDVALASTHSLTININGTAYKIPLAEVSE